jgi:hypothetical protein
MLVSGEGQAKGQHLQYPQVPHVLEIRLKDNSQVVDHEVSETKTELALVSCY